jgi:hypothetical protein
MYRPPIETLTGLSPTEEPTRVVELGSSMYTSRQEEGLLYRQNVHFIALDLPDEFMFEEGDDEEGRYYRIPGVDDERVDYVAGSMHALPFSDESVDVTLMRDVFGQFVNGGSTSSPDDINRWGMLEVGRVLVPDGKLFVFEELTPPPAGEVEDHARSAGLEVVETVYKYEDDGTTINPDWLGVRAQFYSPTTDTHRGRHEALPKCIITRKPAGTATEATMEEVVINSHKIAGWIIEHSGDNEPPMPRPEPENRLLPFKRIVPPQ